MKRSTVSKLPFNILLEVKQRLLSGEYDQIEIVSWLKNHGHSITKSALSRYAVKLRAGNIDREILAVKYMDISALFDELVQIRAREAKIFAQIKKAIAS